MYVPKFFMREKILKRRKKNNEIKTLTVTPRKQVQYLFSGLVASAILLQQKLKMTSSGLDALITKPGNKCRTCFQLVTVVFPFFLNSFN